MQLKLQILKFFKGRQKSQLLFCADQGSGSRTCEKKSKLWQLNCEKAQRKPVFGSPQKVWCTKFGQHRWLSYENNDNGSRVCIFPASLRSLGLFFLAFNFRISRVRLFASARSARWFAAMTAPPTPPSAPSPRRPPAGEAQRSPSSSSWNIGDLARRVRWEFTDDYI